MKYFIEHSFVLFKYFFLWFLIRVQKERVLISKATHKTNQEFLIMHIIGVKISEVVIIGSAEISISLIKIPSCKFGEFFEKTCFEAMHILKI